MAEITTRTVLILLSLFVLFTIGGTWLIIKGLNEPGKTKIVSSETSQAGGQFGLEIIPPEERGQKNLINTT